MGNLTSRAKRTFDEDDKDIIPSVRPSKRQKIAYNGCSKRSAGSDNNKSSPQPLNIIMTVWQTLEPFLTLEDTIASSKTCKTLHDTIIDADTRKVKVSRFTMLNTRRKTKSEIEQYLPRVMNSIHFPSLQNIRYPPTIVRDTSIGSVNQVFDDEITEIIDVCSIVTCFPMFVAYLSQARNLESFTFDANCMMSSLYDNQSLRNMFSIFSTNLGSCYKLKELRVRNSGDVESDEDEVSGAYFSVELLAALVPVIYRRRDCLEVLMIDIIGLPIPTSDSYPSELEKVQVAHDFFRVVLKTTKVKDFTLELSCLPMIALSQITDDGIMRRGYEYQFNHLKKLKLNFTEGTDLVSLSPVLKVFSNCHSLESLNIDFQEECWDDNECISSFAKLLGNNTNLKTLAVDFNKFDDQDEKVLQLLRDFAKDCKSNKYPQIKYIDLRRLKLDHKFHRSTLAKAFDSVPRLQGGQCDRRGQGYYTIQRWNQSIEIDWLLNNH